MGSREDFYNRLRAKFGDPDTYVAGQYAKGVLRPKSLELIQARHRTEAAEKSYNKARIARILATRERKRQEAKTEEMKKQYPHINDPEYHEAEAQRYQKEVKSAGQRIEARKNQGFMWPETKSRGGLGGGGLKGGKGGPTQDQRIARVANLMARKKKAFAILHPIGDEEPTISVGSREEPIERAAIRRLIAKKRKAELF